MIKVSDEVIDRYTAEAFKNVYDVLGGKPFTDPEFEAIKEENPKLYQMILDSESIFAGLCGDLAGKAVKQAQIQMYVLIKRQYLKNVSETN